MKEYEDIENKTFQKQTIENIPLEQISPDPTQPRKYFNPQALNELAESIKTHGLLQPILVRPNGNSGFIIVHGERRYKAHKIACLPTIKCIIQDLSDSKVANVRVVENTAREDLSDMELAYEFQRRVATGETHEQIGKSINKSRAFVTQRLALLRLPEERQEQLKTGKITFAEARFLTTTSENPKVENQHCYAVTMEDLEVYKLFQKKERPVFDVLYSAYRKDLATLRRAKQ
jgi:ParB family chromosome partitioning protein